MNKKSTKRRTARVEISTSRVITSRTAAAVSGTTTRSGHQTLPKVPRTGSNQNTQSDCEAITPTQLVSRGILLQQSSLQQATMTMPTSHINTIPDDGITILYSRVNTTVSPTHGANSFAGGTTVPFNRVDTKIPTSHTSNTSAVATISLHCNVSTEQTETDNMVTWTEKCENHALKSAFKWCSECDEALCVDCIEYHGRVSLSKDHTAISFSDYLKLPPFVRSFKRYCETHDEQLDCFCQTHYETCCFQCYQTAHKQCIGVERIQKLAKAIKCSESIDIFEQDIEDLKTNIKNILQNMSQNISDLDRSSHRHLIKIQETKQELIKELDNLEKQMISELTNKVNKEKSRIHKLQNKIEEKNIKARKISQDFQIVKDIAPDIPTFLSKQYLGKEVIKEVNSLKELEKDGQFMHTVISYTKPINTDGIFTNIKPLGNIVVELNNVNTLTWKEKREHNAQTDQNVKKDRDNREDFLNNVLGFDTETSKSEVFDLNVHFKSEMFIKTKGGTITVCKMLRDNNIVFADNTNSSLLFYNFDEKFFKTIDLTSKPFDIACTSECLVAVTLSDENVVCLINVFNGSELKRMKTIGPCYGIAFAGDKLYINIRLSHQTVIKTIRLSGNVCRMENTLETFSSNGFNICHFDNKLYYGNSTLNKLICISSEGKSLWEYQHDSTIEPSCIITTSSGGTYIACKTNGSMIALSIDGTKGHKLVPNDKTIETISTMDFCPESKRLIICDEKSGTVYVYKPI